MIRYPDWAMPLSTVLDRSDLIGKKAAEAVSKAIEENLEDGFPVVYLEGKTILKEYPDGRKEEIGRVSGGARREPPHRRAAAAGDRA